MNTGLGHPYCLTIFLTKAECFSTCCKLPLAPEMDKGGKPAFHKVYKCFHQEWNLMFCEVKKKRFRTRSIKLMRETLSLMMRS